MNTKHFRKMWRTFFLVFATAFGSSTLFPYSLTAELAHSPTSIVGSVPSWLKGVFARQSCGAFGDVGVNQTSPRIDNIEGLFDCFGQVAVFYFNNGSNVTFSNAFYRTQQFKIWEANRFDFSVSHQAWRNAQGPHDVAAWAQWKESFTQFYQANPNVELGVFNGRLQALTETPLLEGLEVDVQSLGMKLGSFQYNDNGTSIRLEMCPQCNTPYAQIFSSSVHMGSDLNGTGYVSNAHFLLLSDDVGRPIGGTFFISLLKIVGDVRSYNNNMTIPIGSFNLSLCKNSDTIYPDGEGMVSYIHTVTATKRYVILAMGSQAFNPCAMFKKVGDNGQGMLQFLTFSPNKKSYFLLFDKLLEQWLPRINVEEPFFNIHASNSFESPSGQVVTDWMSYDFNAYGGTLNDFVRDLKQWNQGGKRGQPQRSGKLVRYVLDLSTRQTKSVQLMTQFTSLEFPHINENVLTLEHQFVYAVGTSYPGGNFFFPGQAAIGKLDLLSNVFTTWGPLEYITVQEPRFEASPNPQSEDDGVIICGGFNASSLEGIVVIIDAKSMQQLALVSARQLTPYGLHNHFFRASIFK